MIHHAPAAMMLVATILGVIASALRAQSTQPADENKAHAILDDVREAYAALKSLALEGEYTLELDAAGRRETKSAPFSASYVAANRFRHEMVGDALVVSTGQKVYLYVPDAAHFAVGDAPPQRGDVGALPEPIAAVLREQNPALCLAISDDAARELMSGGGSVAAEAVERVDGVAYRVLRIEREDRDLRLLIDPRSSMLRRIDIDLRKMLLAKSVPHVSVARLTVEYAAVKIDPEIDEARFAWAPPEGATLSKGVARALTRPDPMALVGSPAPGFSLTDLDGNAMSLVQHRGSVVVLDFWATWCGPCRTAMPHLEQLHKDFAGQAVKVIAVNLREPRQTVKTFMDHNKFTMPVLLDATGKVAERYAVSGIPQTVVIGKNGAIRKVIVGFAPGGEKHLREAVQQALDE